MATMNATSMAAVSRAASRLQSPEISSTPQRSSIQGRPIASRLAGEGPNSAFGPASW
jgi:hypothetical protein